MKGTAKNIEFIEQCLNLSNPDDKHRQAVINKVTLKLLLECSTEKEALSLFFWKLADLELPVTYGEQMIFRALYRMFHICCDIEINSKETAAETLNISKDKLKLPQKEIIKEIKIAYWKQFNELTHDQKSLFANACKIVIKKKAFIFLCNALKH